MSFFLDYFLYLCEPLYSHLSRREETGPRRLELMHPTSSLANSILREISSALLKFRFGSDSKVFVHRLRKPHIQFDHEARHLTLRCIYNVLRDVSIQLQSQKFHGFCLVNTF